VRGALARYGAVRRFARLPADERRLVFYSEGPSSWPHLGPLLSELASRHRIEPPYVTSTAQDPGLALGGPAFQVGDRAARDYLFRTAQAGVWVMTTPDLGTFQVKRSAHPVHYVYVHHSMVSTHMIYREQAFDGFDEVFCVGPHHVAEIRAREKLEGLRAKELFAHGYGRLDALMRTVAEAGPRPPVGDRPSVLVAPSWGEHGLLETLGVEVVRALEGAGCDVTVRPHPRTRALRPDALDAISAAFAGSERVVLDEDIAGFASLLAADVMVTDWSGAALEFAFGCERPVLFVDVPRKVNNPSYERLGIDPVEVSLREELGRLLPADRVAEAGEAALALAADRDARAAGLREARSRWVFNPGRSAEAGAARIAELAAEREARV
jgi:YidC/Oxa1 family membrane protein insertase